MFNTPVLYLVFNRPEETSKSFEVIRKLQPKKLFVAADGPRKDNLNDFLNCEKVKSIILNNIDWDCEIKTLIRNENLGCGIAVQNALNWFFDEVEMGIIIEDDIIPHNFFFMYAELLLNKYKYHEDVFSINGCSLAYENSDYDYGITRYFNMWGWATWRRSNELVRITWPLYNKESDFNKDSEILQMLKLPILLPQKEWFNNWSYLFDNTKKNKIDTWDYQWIYTCLRNQMICIRPNFNMITNIGFNENSTHTLQASHFKLIDIKIDVLNRDLKNLKGFFKIESVYEIINVAEYWNGIKISYVSFFKKNMGFLISKIEKLKN
ncbi:nucleotide-diphospho-sugar transferase [Flavobacterium sp. LB3P21]|uniref:nucleotide-diphospho-sugar transferase n=1 Tax=unclassified Flavobacterium TaxID=196869 RepID=UPI003AAF5617